MSPHLALSSEITKGPQIGSDHLPIHIKIDASPVLSLDCCWNFKNANWITWNNKVNEIISSSQFYHTKDPELKYQAFHSTLLAANKPSKILFSIPPMILRPEPAPPWWNEECRKAVALARKARNACDHTKGGINCETNNLAWREKENQKHRIIMKAKKISMYDHINSLSPKSSPTKTWAFVKAWTKGIQPPDLSSSPIMPPDTNQLITSPEEKAEILASQYDHHKDNIPDKPEFESVINSKVRSADPNPLNSEISKQEVKFGMGNLKSNSMGRDLIHNQMLKNLSDANKKHLLHLLNHMLRTSYVPDDWKQATIIPIRKPDKPAESPDSYRPISLTSCLGKIMERIVNQRLVWMFEKNGLRLKTQSGFRKGRGTMDNIIGLEHYIREGFNKRNPLNTYAVFLDVAKAFDTTWIQGLLFKLSNKGVSGQILGWLNNLLRNRTYCVRIGSKHSQNHPIKVGVPQGSPLSPFLFSVMMDDLPILSSPGQTLMFADDIEFHIHAENGEQAEKLLTPYLESINKWSRKWRVKFSPAKSNLVNFSRAKKSSNPTATIPVRSKNTRG